MVQLSKFCIINFAHALCLLKIIFTAQKLVYVGYCL